MNSITTKNKLFALESLRGIAAVLVALFHYPSSSFLYFDKGFLCCKFLFHFKWFRNFL